MNKPNYMDFCPEHYMEIENYELAKSDNFVGWVCHHRNGEEFELEADGLLARCICHENDHLNGILFIDKSVDGKVYNVGDSED